jgi:hypothetical protein
MMVANVAEILEQKVGGCSGALYSLMLSAAYSELQNKPSDLAAWTCALLAAIRSVER